MKNEFNSDDVTSLNLTEQELCDELRSGKKLPRGTMPSLNQSMLLTACMNDVHAFSQLPQEHHNAVHGAAQMINAVLCGRESMEDILHTQASVRRAVDEIFRSSKELHPDDGDGATSAAYRKVKRLAAHEVPSEILKRIVKCNRLIKFFKSEMTCEQAKELQAIQTQATELIQSASGDNQGKQSPIATLGSAIVQALDEAPASVPLLTKSDLKWLKRFRETTGDDQNHDLPKEALDNLVGLGAVRWCGGTRYAITAFGEFADMTASNAEYRARANCQNQSVDAEG